MNKNEFLEKKSQEFSITGNTYLKIKVIPNASKTEFGEVLNGEELYIKLRIKAIAEKGKANKELEKFLGKWFSGKAKIINGHTNSIKLIQIIS